MFDTRNGQQLLANIERIAASLEILAASVERLALEFAESRKRMDELKAAMMAMDSGGGPGSGKPH